MNTWKGNGRFKNRLGRFVEGPIGDSPQGTYAGMFRDKYGIEWIVEFDPEG